VKLVTPCLSSHSEFYQINPQIEETQRGFLPQTQTGKEDAPTLSLRKAQLQT